MASVEIEFLNVGQGDSTLIRLSNGKTVLIDCHFTGGYEKVLEDLVSNLSRDENGRPVLDCLIITHPHDDHIGGIGKLAESVIVKSIWESGHRLYIPREDREKYPHYYDMLDLISKVKRQGGEVKVLRANSKGLTGGLDDQVTWYCLSPSRAYVEEDRPSEEQIHAQCLVLKMEYGGTSVLFPGDSTWQTWQERIVPSYSDLLKTDLLHVSHHGSISFFADGEDADLYTEHLEAIDPDLAIISVGDNEYGHPNKKALQQYCKYTYHYRKGEGQVFRTDELGTIISQLFDDGCYTIMPRYHRQAFSGKFPLCKAHVVPNPPPDEDGTYRRGVNIRFKLCVTDVRGGAQVGSIKWEVQNNGKGIDQRVHDWYIGNDSEKQEYQNRTAFFGTHNLYVKVASTRGVIMAEFVHHVKVRDEG